MATSRWERWSRAARARAQRAGRRVRAPADYRRERWVTDELGRFRLDQQRSIFLSIARYAHANRPLHGYYFEFGCHTATTMRMAYDAFHHLFDWTYVAFDSFSGMPEPAGGDRSGPIRAGMNATTEAQFVTACLDHGMPDDKLIVIRGFYSESLTEATKERLLPDKAAVVFVDCDYYESAAQALSFARGFLQRGTIVVLDDWNLYFGDPDYGERRAWSEFRAAHPQLRWEPFVQTAEARAFICLGETEDGEKK